MGVITELDSSATLPLREIAYNTQSVVVWVDLRFLIAGIFR